MRSIEEVKASVAHFLKIPETDALLGHEIGIVVYCPGGQDA